MLNGIRRLVTNVVRSKEHVFDAKRWIFCVQPLEIAASAHQSNSFDEVYVHEQSSTRSHTQIGATWNAACVQCSIQWHAARFWSTANSAFQHQLYTCAWVHIQPSSIRIRAMYALLVSLSFSVYECMSRSSIDGLFCVRFFFHIPLF